MMLTGLLAATAMLWTHYVAWQLPEHTSKLAARYFDPVPFDVGADSKAREIRLMLDMGIDGMFIDAVFQKDHSKTHYSNLQPFLDGATGTPFKVSFCCDVKTDVDWQVAEMVRMLRAYAPHPNFPKENGRPVVATYTWWGWSPEEWRRIRAGLRAAGFDPYLIANVTFSYKKFDLGRIESYADCFDAIYNFGHMGLNGVPVAENNRIERAFSRKNGTRFVPGLHPGYLGAWLNGRNDYYLPLRHLDALHECFLSAMEGDGASEPWFHLTSWNDHDETTVAPRVLTGGMRQLVRAYSDVLKRLPPSAEAPDVVFAYHREELAGTLLRIEALRLPAKRGQGDAVSVSGRLCDDRGETVVTLEPKKLLRPFDRTEWLVPTASLAKSPLLTPTFSISTGRASRFSPIFLVDPWIENQQIVRQTFASRADARTGLRVRVQDERLEAEAAYEGGRKLKRAVLYRNERPLGTFALEKFAPSVLERDTAGNEVSLRVYDSKALGVTRGRLFLSVATARPALPSDAFWVRYETEDDAIAESSVSYPFATETDRQPVKARLLETPVSLETTSGACGAPGAADFLTPTDSLPVRAPRLVETEISPFVERTLRIDTADRPPKRKGKKGTRNLLPHRSWPMTRAAISFEVKPAPGGARSLISKAGWQGGFSFALDVEGRVQATWSAKENDERITVVSSRPLRFGEWNSIALSHDLKTIRLKVNGEEVAKPFAVQRVYGNCRVTFGTDPIRNLTIGCRPTADEKFSNKKEK